MANLRTGQDHGRALLSLYVDQNIPQCRHLPEIDHLQPVSPTIYNDMAYVLLVFMSHEAGITIITE